MPFLPKSHFSIIWLRCLEIRWNSLGGGGRYSHFFLDMKAWTQHLLHTPKYEGCSNMNASSFITFFTYMLRQNVIPFWKELFVAFKMTPAIKKHSLYFSSYRRLYKGHSCILKFFVSKLRCTFWYMYRYSVISG